MTADGGTRRSSLGVRMALVGAGAVVCGPEQPGPVRHASVDHLGIRTDVGVGVEGDRIALIAPDRDLRDWLSAVPRTTNDEPRTTLLDVQGRLITPGLVDCHTHLVFGKPRLDDQARRARGEDYKAIAAAGGGILSSVRDLRARGEDELVALARERLDWVASLGTTTVEIKSGYGLTLEDELKSLTAVRRLQADVPLTLVPTFLGAHEVPEEYRHRRSDYVRYVAEVMIPAVARGRLAQFCDVFCEPGVFGLEETEAILTAAGAHGLRAKLHADELDPSGGAELAARLGAVSADHLAAISPAGIDALAASDTVAVILPGTLLFLGKTRQAPARALVDAGAVVAVASDFNPGSSPSGNLPLMMAMAVSQARLQPAEAFIGATVNAACAVGLGDERGRLAPGARADLVVWNCRDVRELCYWYGMPLAWRSYAAGVLVTSQGAG